MTLNAANILTLSRLILTPIFLLFFAWGHQELAILVFCLAGFTDLIDGTVARLISKPSKWGALLDPIADKILVQSCFVALFVKGLLPWWFVLLALMRDTMIISGIIYLERIKASLPYRPTLSSKMATLLQLGVAVLGLVRWWQPQAVVAGSTVEIWHGFLVLAASVMIAVSGTQYVLIGCDILRKHTHTPS